MKRLVVPLCKKVNMKLEKIIKNSHLGILAIDQSQLKN